MSSSTYPLTYPVLQNPPALAWWLSQLECWPADQKVAGFISSQRQLIDVSVSLPLSLWNQWTSPQVRIKATTTTTTTTTMPEPFVNRVEFTLFSPRAIVLNKAFLTSFYKHQCNFSFTFNPKISVVTGSQTTRLRHISNCDKKLMFLILQCSCLYLISSWN